MRVGSHLYGTAVETSDIDIKAVYLPTAADILLQRVEPTLTEAARAGTGKVDVEIFSLGRYLALLAAGQTIAIDMLFAPDGVMLREPHPVWQELRRNSHRLVSRKVGSFLRYARRQAAKFGTKGARLAAARRLLDLLRAAEGRHGGRQPLASIEAELALVAGTDEQISLVDLATPGGGTIRHLDIGGRRAPFTGSLKAARELVEHVIGSYGVRAAAAEAHDGVDWKALAHAVRIGREAEELLLTGRIVFPLSSARELLAIRQGAVPHQRVIDEIESLSIAMEAAAARSSLPDEPDHRFIEELLLRCHREQVLGTRSSMSPSSR